MRLRGVRRDGALCCVGTDAAAEACARLRRLPTLPTPVHRPIDISTASASHRTAECVHAPR
ncbi:hypothetical protein BVI434_2080013 [Burkholderia vietnamiensis]|nr:hypothetical protein BVI434_2080013 [Burkholderia vietnamiensis]